MKDNDYAIYDGTSFAAPQVGATAALILSRFPDFTAQDIEEVLCLTTMKLPSYEFLEGYEYGSWNNYVGYGKLNADRAIGIKEDISLDVLLEEGNYIIDEVHVSNNSTLTFSKYSRFYFLKEGELYVDEGSTLVIEDNVKITGKGISKIIINGNLQIGSFVSFIAEEGTTLQIEINNLELLVDFSNTTFINAELLLTNCDFIGLPSLSAIEIENYPNFRIQNCSIINYIDAISLYNCGNGENDQSISNNVISENSGTGITMYRSLVDILHNVIENNTIGIRCFDRSNIHIEGDIKKIMVHCELEPYRPIKKMTSIEYDAFVEVREKFRKLFLDNNCKVSGFERRKVTGNAKLTVYKLENKITSFDDLYGGLLELHGFIDVIFRENFDIV